MEQSIVPRRWNMQATDPPGFETQGRRRQKSKTEFCYNSSMKYMNVLADGEPPDVAADERVGAGGRRRGAADRGVGAPLGRVLLLQQLGRLRLVVLSLPHRKPLVVVPQVVQTTYHKN